MICESALCQEYSCADINIIGHVGISIISHVNTVCCLPPYQYTKLSHIFMVTFNIIIDVYLQLCTKTIIRVYLNTLYDM